MTHTEPTYDELAKSAVSLSYRDKFRLAQLLIQLARKEEEEQYPQQRVPTATENAPTDVLAYVAERICKLRPSKKAALLNSINAMFQFQGGISEQERDKVVAALQKHKHIAIDGNGHVTYPV